MSRFARTLMPIALAALVTALAPAGFIYADDDDDEDDWQCGMMQSQLRSRIASQGYTHVTLNVPNNGRVQAHGDKGGVSYLLLVDACNGNVLGRKQRGAA